MERTDAFDGHSKGVSPVSVAVVDHETLEVQTLTNIKDLGSVLGQ